MTNEQTKPCPWCGRPTFDSYSEKRAVMYGNGYETRHFTQTRVGDGAMLGPVECPEGQMGDNGGVFNK